MVHVINSIASNAFIIDIFLEEKSLDLVTELYCSPLLRNLYKTTLFSGNSIRSGSLELPLGAQGVDSDKLHTTDDNFADLEAYMSPESLKLIRQIHGRKNPVTRVPRYETPSPPSSAHTPERGSIPSEFIHLSGKIEIL